MGCILAHLANTIELSMCAAMQPYVRLLSPLVKICHFCCSTELLELLKWCGVNFVATAEKGRRSTNSATRVGNSVIMS